VKERADIIHVQHGWLLFGGPFQSLLFPALMILLRLLGKPTIITMHVVVKRESKISRNSLVNFLIHSYVVFVSKFIEKFFNMVIVHNKLMKCVLQREYDFNGNKIFVIPHGVRKPSNNLIEKSYNGLTVLTFGFIRKEKGLEYLIEAFKKFVLYYRDARLIIAGGSHAHDDIDYTKQVKSKIDHHEQGKVIFTGYLSEGKLDELISVSDIIVLPSLELHYIEASGTIARVAGYGKPIICSRVPKFKCELEENKDCIMFDPHDPDQILKALILLSDNANMRKYIGESLKDKFRSRYWNIVAQQHLELYKSMLSQ
jgi:glycosyltransferase involved in cell wall biosynthesis